MMNKIKLLWIEEEIPDRLAERYTYLLATFKFDIIIADNAFEALKLINENHFDIIIVDIRILSGNYVLKNPLNKQKLGLEIIDNIYALKKVTKNIGIYSNERWEDISNIVSHYGIESKQFRQKSSISTNKEFLEFIESFL